MTLRHMNGFQIESRKIRKSQDPKCEPRPVEPNTESPHPHKACAAYPTCSPQALTPKLSNPGPGSLTGTLKSRALIPQALKPQPSNPQHQAPVCSYTPSPVFVKRPYGVNPCLKQQPATQYPNHVQTSGLFKCGVCFTGEAIRVHF